MQDDTEINGAIARMRMAGAHIVVEHGPCQEVGTVRVLGGAPGIELGRMVEIPRGWQ